MHAARSAHTADGAPRTLRVIILGHLGAASPRRMSFGDIDLVDDLHHTVPKPCGANYCVALRLGPNPAAEHDSATGDLGVYVTAVLRLLVALKGLHHEPVDVGGIHVEANLDRVFDAADAGQPADGRFGGRPVPSIPHHAGQRDVAILRACL